MERFDLPGTGGTGEPRSAAEMCEWGERLASELDPRLADVWSCVFSIDAEPTLEQLGWFLRMAYLNGYEDGLTETTRGKLLEDLNLRVCREGETSPADLSNRKGA